MEKKITITGIKIKQGGMKGLDIDYRREWVDKDGKEWNVNDWTDRKIPVGEKLDKVAKAFRYYLLDIYGYDMDSANFADVSISKISFEGGIKIAGEMKILNGVRCVKLDTTYVDDSLEYDKLGELEALVGQLKDEVLDYMEGKSVMSDNQLVMQFYKKKGKFDEAEFAGMSDEDKKIKATEILEGFGSLVIHNDDMSVGGSAEVVDTTMSDAEDTAEIAPVEFIEPNFEAVEAEPIQYMDEVKAEEVFVHQDEDGEEVFMIAAVKSV